MTIMVTVAKPVNGFSYKFVRIEPKTNDGLNLNYLIDKYEAYCGYTFEFMPSGRRCLKGFIVFPVRVSVDYIRRRLPNFLVDTVKEFDKIETRFKNCTTTVWRNQHPLNDVRSNLAIDKFDDDVE